MFNKFCKGFYICCKKSGDFINNNYEKITNFIMGFWLILLAAVFFWIVGLKITLIFLSVIAGIVIIDFIYEKGKKVANQENKGSEKNV